jgi:hypothetical protein
MTQVLSIRHQQTLDLSDTGALREGRDVEVALRYAALTGGWLARFSGSREGRTAMPVLLALVPPAAPTAQPDSVRSSPTPSTSLLVDSSVVYTIRWKFEKRAGSM